MDLRFALRTLRRGWWVTAIGGNATVFAAAYTPVLDLSVSSSWYAESDLSLQLRTAPSLLPQRLQRIHRRGPPHRHYRGSNGNHDHHHGCTGHM